MGIREQAQIRQILVDGIEADIVGPHADDEVLTIDPKYEYLAGVISPRYSEHYVEAEIREDGSEEDDDDNTGTFSHTSYDRLFNPSSFGLTCNLDPDTKKITALITYGTYSAIKDENSRRTKYRRTPKSEKFDLAIIEGEHETKFDTHPKFMIKYTVKREDYRVLLDFYVINGCDVGSKNALANLMFQPKIVLESGCGNFPFLHDAAKQDADHQLDVLFRDKTSFGKGHLCAVTWDAKKDVDGATARRIETTFVPRQRVERVSPATLTNEIPCLDMVKLAECADKSDLAGMLGEVISLYSDWVDEASESADGLGKDRDAVMRNISRCRNAAARMRKGVDAIIGDNNVFDAFRFANMAIAWQQTMSRWVKSNATTGEVVGHGPLEPDRGNCRWRLFQIAFILLSIESVANPRSEDRDVADLLWFPTGGGKTEAYLGLVAFVIAHRRLCGKNDEGELTSESLGTSVLMRYTLRLLTVQQFQRAATLMCACEKIRSGDVSQWGRIPFQVGLWVGGEVTPNKREKGDTSALQMKSQLRGSSIAQIHSHNPYILINCPWCGTKITPSDGEVSGEPKQWRLYCGRNRCMFSKHLDVNKDMSLPVVLVDEDVYSRCPSMIVSTVDKFAQISWKAECRSIFGMVTKYCDRCGFYDPKTSSDQHAHRMSAHESNNFSTDVKLKPPELIIQDELHLISGALGSMASIYETAIDHLCTGDGGIRPKVIASTATTRRAEDHIQKLFCRKTEVFPPQVSRFGDTFFSKADSGLDEDRIYLGVLGTGKSGLNAMNRVSAVILRNIRRLAESGKFDIDDLDPYVTLVSYFNTLKSLGGASMGFKDSVPELISRIQNRFEAGMSATSNEATPPDRRRIPPSATILKRQFYELYTEELTSRKSSGEIPDILRKLEITLGEGPLDLLLATNMLSVGVDISRLGVMVVGGQPKGNSEYIQATGRIGRRNPGLVVTIYSYTKPRDVSHYEDFKIYHKTLFKKVEAASITPFTARTRDTALFGVFVGMLRMKNAMLSQNKDANRFDPGDRDQQRMLDEVRGVIENRVREIAPEERDGAMNDLDGLINAWDNYRKRHHDLLLYANVYSEKSSKGRSESYWYLLKSHQESREELMWVPTSLRSAEQEQRLFYAHGEHEHGR